MSQVNPMLGRVITFGPSAGGSLSGMKSKNTSFLGEPVDVTTDEDDGWQTFLTDAPRKGISLSVEGITKDTQLIEGAGQDGVIALSDYKLTIPGVGHFDGDFIASGVQLKIEEDGAVGFSATIQSNGELDFTEVTV